MGLIFQSLTGGTVAASGSLDVALWPLGPPLDRTGSLQWQLSVTGSSQFEALVQGRLDPSLSWLDLGGVSGTSNDGLLLGGSITLWPYLNLHIINYDSANSLTAVTVWASLEVVGNG